MSSSLRSKKRGNTIIWALMALLVLGLGGFGARNFGGSVQSIGTVGENILLCEICEMKLH